MSIVSSKPTITRKELESVLDCLINDELTTGDPVKLFESSLSELTGIKYTLAVNSHTAAYHLAFKALDIKGEDEVIIPSFFSPGPLNALILTGGKPVLVDIADNLLVPSVDEIKKLVTPATKAIIIGYPTGVTVNFEPLKELNIPIIEDISHSLGAADSEEKQLSKIGTITVASFSPIDMITTGNGGAVLTTNSKLYSAMKEMRFNSDTTYFDYTMTDFQGAMGLSQLSRIQDFIRRRREIAQVYYDRARMTPHKPLYPMNRNFTYQSFPLIFDASSENCDKYWKKSGIEVAKVIEKPLHVHLGLKPMDFPQSDRMSKKLYTLPIYPALTKKEIEKISRHLAKFI